MQQHDCISWVNSPRCLQAVQQALLGGSVHRESLTTTQTLRSGQ
jgi:hypothetical protein